MAFESHPQARANGAGRRGAEGGRAGSQWRLKVLRHQKRNRKMLRAGSTATHYKNECRPCATRLKSITTTLVASQNKMREGSHRRHAASIASPRHGTNKFISRSLGSPRHSVTNTTHKPACTLPQAAALTTTTAYARINTASIDVRFRR